jgi:4a-hydroxytetrahydrobiopterin dehydratase
MGYEPQDASVDVRENGEEDIMAEDLSSKTCVPCRGGIPPLGEAEAKVFARQTPAWELAGEDDNKAHHIRRTFKFGDFKEALDFVDKVGAIAEAEGHHPDIEFGWGYATVKTYTHKIDGLHENDFILAAKIDKAAGAR